MAIRSLHELAPADFDARINDVIARNLGHLADEKLQELSRTQGSDPSARTWRALGLEERLRRSLLSL